MTALAPVTAHVVGVQVIKTLIILTLLVAGFRVFGKREASQLNVYDLAMLMALANAVQNSMTGGLGNLPDGSGHVLGDPARGVPRDPGGGPTPSPRAASRSGPRPCS